MYPKGKGYVSKSASAASFCSDSLSVRRTLILQPGGSQRRS